MKILPGNGIGNVQFGMLEKEIISSLGKPDRVDESEYVEGTGDWNRELWYTNRNLTFTFNKDDNWRLGTITIMGSGHTLFNKNLFGVEIDEIKKIITKHTNEIARFEDWSSEEIPEHELLMYDTIGIMFWFDYKKLSQMQCSYLFESDNETILWPNKL
ncbi:hypothetical protein OS175_12825 [Marinicella sp. S1101]|uniref:hypothetical protein n=1 Tax=Marinicella marina TaxID=2996016 RepID=UPI002260AF0F|nr:hypothetical protein [Marinicella marina]MCX7554758.1 hypothetical protein [Marinicella marina]MDJ1141426.1 hypothetical protein [Marinicella marina]